MDGESTIELVPVGPVDRAVLDRLREPLRERFSRRVEVGAVVPRQRLWYEAGREQYRADVILDMLVGREMGPEVWMLGVVDADLGAPGLTYVFGQATVGGCCAVIGLGRLRPEFHDEPADEGLFRRRVLTEAVHELGHIAGLTHCPDRYCVMHFSSTLEETDRKGADFCSLCRLEDAGRSGAAS